MTTSLIKLPFTGEPPQVAEIRTFAGFGRVFVKIADVEKAFEDNPLLKMIAPSIVRKSSRSPMKSPAVHDLLANSCIPEVHLQGKGYASFYPLVGLANGRYREP